MHRRYGISRLLTAFSKDFLWGFQEALVSIPIDRDAPLGKVPSPDLHRIGMDSKRKNPLLFGLATLAIVAASQVALANVAGAGGLGTLVLSGGIHATFKLDPSTCVAGPGEMLTVNAGSGGGWGSLSLTASDPKPGKRGTAVVDLDETGYTGAPFAVADWAWTAKKHSGHISRPLSISSNGDAGAIHVVLAVSDSFDGPKTKPVEIAIDWSSGACKE
jgi:hypothetical protein